MIKYSKHIQTIAKDIASHYARFSKADRLYDLQLEQVADFDLHELSAALIQEDPMLASEATGPDNPDYATKMLPALINHMTHSIDKEIQAEFMKLWCEGITAYCTDIITKLVDDALYQMNCDLVYHEDPDYARDTRPEQSQWL